MTEVPAEIPFSTHVSHGLLRGLRPPVPFPEIVVVEEFTADATSAKSIKAAHAANNEDKKVFLKNVEWRELMNA